MPYATYDDRTGKHHIAFDHTAESWCRLVDSDPSLANHLRTFCCHQKAHAKLHPTPHDDHLIFIHRPAPSCKLKPARAITHLERRVKRALVETARELKIPFTLEQPLETKNGCVVTDAFFHTQGGHKAVISDYAFDKQRIETLSKQLADQGTDVLWITTEQLGHHLGHHKIVILSDTYPYPGKSTAGWEPRTLPLHTALRSTEVSWRTTYRARPDPQVLSQFLKGTLIYFQPDMKSPITFGLYVKPAWCIHCNRSTPVHAFAGIGLQLPDTWCYLPSEILQCFPKPLKALSRVFPQVLHINGQQQVSIGTSCPNRSCRNRIFSSPEYDNYAFPGDARETRRYLYAAGRSLTLAYSAPLPEKSVFRDVFQKAAASGWCSTGGAYDDPSYDTQAEYYIRRYFPKPEQPEDPYPDHPLLPLTPRSHLP